MQRKTTLVPALFLVAGASAPAWGAAIIDIDFDGFTDADTTVTNDGTASDGVVVENGNGAVNATTGTVGQAAAFVDANAGSGTSAQGGEIEVGNVQAITGDFTYALSIRPDGPQVSFDHLINFTSAGTDAAFVDPSLVFSDGDTIRIRLSDRQFFVDLNVNDDDYQHLAVTYDANGGNPADTDGLIQVYLDGSLVGSSAFVDNNGTKDDLNTMTSTVTFGAQATGNRPFDGDLDNLFLDQQFRTATEIEELFLSTIPEPASLALMAVGGLCLLGRSRRR